MNNSSLNLAQIARRNAINAEIEITLDALADCEIDLECLAMLLDEQEEGSIKHAAYTCVFSIMASN